MITLVLPYPISANRYWRPVHIGPRITIVPTKEAKEYRALCAEIARGAMLREPFGHRVAVELDLYPQRPQDWARRAARAPMTWDDDVRCIDLGNAEKVLSDALQGVVFTDDRWIWDLHKKRKEPDGEARVVVRITPLARQVHPQSNLLETA